MDLSHISTKDRGVLGEQVAIRYLKSKGFKIIDTNVARKTGEIDIIAKKGQTLHFVEVKSVVRPEFKKYAPSLDEYDPSVNLHAYKVRKVARTAQWYVSEIDWEGEWQIDAVLVWLRERDGAAQVEYLPQIV